MRKEKDKTIISVWMDHASAKFIPIPGNMIHSLKAQINTRRISGEGTGITKLGNFRLTNNEYKVHKKIKGQHQKFFDELAEALISFDTIHIFGPGTAHQEFYNFLSGQKKYANKEITTTTTGYLTEKQIIHFAGENFLKMPHQSIE